MCNEFTLSVNRLISRRSHFKVTILVKWIRVQQVPASYKKSSVEKKICNKIGYWSLNTAADGGMSFFPRYFEI